MKILTKKEIKGLIKHLHEIYENNPYSRVWIDIHILPRMPKDSEIKYRTIFWKRTKKYKIKRKTKMTFRFWPVTTIPEPDALTILARTPVMYKHNG